METKLIVPNSKSNKNIFYYFMLFVFYEIKRDTQRIVNKYKKILTKN